MDIQDLNKLAHQLRKTVLDMAWSVGSGHIGGSFSCAEIMTVLYNEVMNIDPANPKMKDRDIFILSKGHAAPSLYFTLAKKGFFGEEQLDSFRQGGSILQGHPDMNKVPGVEISTGSLGMGISNGIGFCLGARLNGISNKVYVLCGDGELDEGQCWEAFVCAVKFGLEDLIVIIDRNHVQLDGTTEEIMPLNNLERRLKAIGWNVLSCDGHNVEELLGVFEKATQTNGKPNAIIASTIKGKGVSFMEGRHVWHGKPLTEEEYKLACDELAKGSAG